MIKSFAAEDFQKCCDLYIHVFNSPPWNDQWTNENVHVYLQELIDHKRFLGYTLWDDDILVGAIFAHMKNHYRGDEIFIDELFISQDHQRKGCGMLLMDTIENYATADLFISVTLLTGVGKAAFDFYEKRGYKHLDYLAFMYKRMV